VPAEFIPQHTDVANPPSLLLLVERLVAQGGDDARFVQVILPRLETWITWFNDTQKGVLPNSYYWRGRKLRMDQLNPLTLSSGFVFSILTTHTIVQVR